MLSQSYPGPLGTSIPSLLAECLRSRDGHLNAHELFRCLPMPEMVFLACDDVARRAFQLWMNMRSC